VTPVPDLLFTYTSTVKALSVGIPHRAAILGRQPLLRALPEKKGLCSLSKKA